MNEENLIIPSKIKYSKHARIDEALEHLERNGLKGLYVPHIAIVRILLPFLPVYGK